LRRHRAHGGSFPPLADERIEQMFTRVVELTSKPGKAQELSNTINEKGVPILQKQNGFVDEIILNSDAEPDRVLALSFWKTKEDAERYRREQYKNVLESVRHLLQSEPNIRTFDVHTSTGQKIAAERAA
jgi:heme-degrading monooxygenase HmoA